MAEDFVHLHNHTHYSLLQALPKIPELVGRAKAQGATAVAMTDNGVLYGAIEFYKACKKNDMNPIIGMDAYIAPNGMSLKRPKIDNKPWRLTLLAENNTGYHNLVTLSSLGFTEGFYYKPRIDMETLAKHKEGLIVLSGGRFGHIASLLASNKKEQARTLALELQALFGKDNFFLELVDRPEIPEQRSINAQLIEIGVDTEIPVVATKDSYYLDPEDREAWTVMKCVAQGRTLAELGASAGDEYDASMVDPKKMIQRFADTPEAITNTALIAGRCHLDFELGVWNFPNIEVPEGETFLSELEKRARTTAKERFGDPLPDHINERIAYELGIIKDKGFPSYFLIVSDFISWAKQQGIMTTTRGSAAGSLVGYLVDISNVDPIHYQLPFERFLNPGRPSAPDVDADFADNRRDEVLAYVTEKYGQDKVAQICTFGTMLARGSVRDVGRALGYSYRFCDQVAKLIPMGKQGMPMTLKRALDESKELSDLYKTNTQVSRLINLAQKIEGCARHTSIHAAGTVISPTPLTDFTPLQVESREGKVITQYDMHAVEDAGLLKMDFLGIRNLSILGDAIRIVGKTKGDDIDIFNIPVDDKKTFELLAAGHTMGVFQLGSSGMTRYLMELRPTRVEDIMAMVALYRPGPMEFIPEYIRRAHDNSLVDYPHEELKEILEKSLGLLIYQDDVMLTAIKLAGYSWLEADKFRKAMGKKIPELMNEQKKKFKDGCVEHGISKTLVDDLWNRIEPFAMYAFNKAHACSYGMVAYQTAYMKANYPAEYMAALMTNESHDLDKIALAVRESERLGITCSSARHQ